MADYIYLLENRLSPTQKAALAAVRDVVRAKGLTLFLVGGAVRDLTSGSPVRDLDVAVQGNALKLRKDLELAGATVTGSLDATQSLFLRFSGGVRMELGGTLSVTYPKPGKPVYKAATILEDLRRRDFTANAMALSLNDGSYGLLMDPLNGVADIENRELRLVSNYGFIEEPVRMIRAVRFSARLGWTLEEKTQGRYETGKAEGYISALQDWQNGYEAEEIAHEEDPLRVMRRLESEGWMQVIAPAWNSSKANVAELDKIREAQTQLQMQAIFPDPATVNFPFLTAKMSAKEVADLKKSFTRQGFVAEIDGLEAEAKAFATELGGKGASKPSAAYRMIMSARPEAVLSVAYSTKSGALQAKFKSFFNEWPQVKHAIPYALMQEMRITPELPGYTELVEKLFFELMDGNLTTVEEMKAYLEPYSPPAPPPPVHLRRPRATRKDAKGAKAKAKREAASDDDDEDDDHDSDEASEASAGDDEDADADAEELGEVAELSTAGRRRRDEMDLDEDDAGDEDEASPVRGGGSAVRDEEEAPAKAQKASKPAAGKTQVAVAPAVTAPAGVEKLKGAAKSVPTPVAPVKADKTPVKVAAKASPAKDAVKASARPAVKVVAKPAPVKVVAKKAPAKAVAKKAAPAKAAKKVVGPVKKIAAKAAPVKTSAKAAKKVAKKAAKSVKAAPAKVVAKKAPAKAAKKVAAKAPVKGKQAPAKAAKAAVKKKR